MKITINRADKALQLAKETETVLNTAMDVAEHGITHFSYPSPRKKLFNIWELVRMVEEVSKGTVTHCYNSGGFATFKIKVV